MQNFLDFEKPLLEIRSKIEELRHLKDTSENIANYGYIHSSCPNAELVCSSIINLPGNLSDKRNIDLLKKLEMILEK